MDRAATDAAKPGGPKTGKNRRYSGTRLHAENQRGQTTYLLQATAPGRFERMTTLLQVLD